MHLTYDGIRAGTPFEDSPLSLIYGHFTFNYHRLSSTIINYQQLSTIIINYHQLSSIIIN